MCDAGTRREGVAECASRASRREWVAVIAVSLLSVVSAWWLYSDYRGDDTWITAVYVRNINRGLGFRFNPSEPPIYAATSPLWTLVLAGTCALTDRPIVPTAQLIGGALCLVSLLLFWRLCRSVFGGAMSVLAVLMLAFDPHFLKLEYLGMESGLTLTLLLGALLLGRRHTSRAASLAAMVLAGLLALTRPEGIVLMPLLLAERCLTGPSRHTVKDTALLCAAWAFVIMPWMIYAYLTFGTVVPNTAIAKRGMLPPLEAMRSAMATLMSGQGLAVGLLTCGLLVSGFGATLTLRRFVEGVRENLTLVGGPILLSLSWVLSGVVVVARYQILILPMVIMGGVWGLTECMKALGARSARTRWAVMTPIVVLFGAQSMAVTSLLIWPMARGFTAGFEQTYARIGLWLANNSPKSASVGVADIGVVSYYADRRTIDLFGLVTPEAMAYRGREAEFLERTRPDFYVRRAPPGQSPADQAEFQRVFGPEVISLLEPLLTERIGRLGVRDRDGWQVTLFRFHWDRMGPASQNDAIGSAGSG